MFFSIHSFSEEKLEILEKQKNDLENKIVDLQTQNKSLDEKIRINEARFLEEKKSLAQLVRLSSNLKKLQFGGIQSLENPLVLNKNLTILNKLQTNTINKTRELSYLSFELLEQKKILENQIQDLKKSEQEILNKEKQIVLAETSALKKMEKENIKSLLRFKTQLQKPIETQDPITDFGIRLDVEKQYFIRDTGWLYENLQTEFVRSVGLGTVIFRDQLPYWGESIIIQHEGGYFSVYAGLQNVDKNVNENIQQGEKIGQADKVFYFEFRHKKIPLNFSQWVKK